MSDLGPFAIRRIEPGTAPGTPVMPSSTADAAAASVLKHAAEVFADRVTGEIERDSPADAQITRTIQTQSDAIDAATLTPLLGSLSVPPVLVAPERGHDPLAPESSPHETNGPSIDPSADAMRTSVFHPLADLPAASGSSEGRRVGAEAPRRASEDSDARLQPLLDRFTARSK